MLLKSISERWRRLGLAAALASGVSIGAHAEVWGYIDDRGTAHFASEALDERYELFYRGTSEFSSESLIPRADTPRPVQVPTLQPRLLAYFDVAPGYKLVKRHLREAAQAQQLDLELLQALVATESGFDAGAVSPRGAVGLMQVMPSTAERFGMRGDARKPLDAQLTDPRVNIQIGTRYLRHLMNLFRGRVDLALAAYNAGEGAVLRAGSQIPPIRETQNYVRTVTELYALLKPPPAVVAEQRRAPLRVRVELYPHPVAGHRPPLQALNTPTSSAATLSAMERFAIEYP
jgi:hypothetical protein